VKKSKRGLGRRGKRERQLRRIGRNLTSKGPKKKKGTSENRKKGNISQQQHQIELKGGAEKFHPGQKRREKKRGIFHLTLRGRGPPFPFEERQRLFEGRGKKASSLFGKKGGKRFSYRVVKKSSSLPLGEWVEIKKEEGFDKLIIAKKKGGGVPVIKGGGGSSVVFHGN